MNRRVHFIKLVEGLLFAATLITVPAYNRDGCVGLTLEILGILAVVASALGRAWASGFISGKKNKTLVMDGPYSIMRNPLYFFSFLGFVGAGLVFQSVMLAAGMAAGFFLTHWKTILDEEVKLRELFGATFDDYIRRVPRFFPKTWRAQLPEEASFTPRLFTIAVCECAVIPLVLVVARVVEAAHAHGWLPCWFRLY